MDQPNNDLLTWLRAKLKYTRNYVVLLIGLQSVITIAYMVMHAGFCGYKGIRGETTVQLNKEQLEVVHSILDGDTTQRTVQFMDTSKGDSLEDTAPEPIRRTVSSPANSPNTAGIESRRLATIKDYLCMQLIDWKEYDHERQMHFLGHLDRTAIRSYLDHARFHVCSYFWLSGRLVLLEIWFWTIFGVICSVLFKIYEKKSIYNEEHPGEGGPDPMNRGFDPREILNHLLKLAYAPFISVILILGYQYFASDDHKDVIETSQGIVIIAFLLGFYSQRALAMLVKVRDLLLPYGTSTDTVASGTLPPPIPARIGPITIQLHLSPTVTTDHVDIAEILKNELDSATVTLVPEGGGEAIVAEPTGEEQDATYTAHAPNSIYTVQASKITAQGIVLRGTTRMDTSIVRAIEVEMDEEKVSG